MGVEGNLEISLFPKDGKVSRVEITSSRPLRLTSLFVGKEANEVLSMVSSLYSVCGVAQKAAALGALEAAQDIEVPDTVRRARGLAVLAETAREHILRIAMDWGNGKPCKDLPRIVAMPGNIVKALGEAFSIGGACQADHKEIEGQIALLEGYLEKEILGQAWSEGHEAWLLAQETPIAAKIHDVQAQGWAELGGHAEVLPLPELDSGRLADLFTDPDYVAKPDWQGSVCETTALTRSGTGDLGQGLLARMLALVEELAAIPQGLRDYLEGKGEGPKSDAVGSWGICQVEAARGRLVHGIQLTGEKVDDYRILAPTEWNFHPQGVAAKSLEGLDFEDESLLVEKARHLICAIDPCVAFDIKVG